MNKVSRVLINFLFKDILLWSLESCLTISVESLNEKLSTKILNGNRNLVFVLRKEKIIINSFLVNGMQFLI